MKTILSTLTLAALCVHGAAQVSAQTVIGNPPRTSGQNWVLSGQVSPPDNHGAPIGIVPSLGEYDPFNPLHFAEPISRSRMDVFVTDEITTCPRIWAAPDCPVVVRADGMRAGMVIGNYSHLGPRHITVERIEYPQSVTVTDAWPLYFVAVEE